MNHVRTTRPIKLDRGEDAAEVKATLENTFVFVFFGIEELKTNGPREDQHREQKKSKAARKTS